MPRKRARPVREGVVGKGAPTQSHLAGDLLHRTAGSGSGPGKRAGRKTGTAPRTDFTTVTGRTAPWIRLRPCALPRRAPTDIHEIRRRDRLGGLVHEYQQVA
jgi:hypothetical protein